MTEPHPYSSAVAVPLPTHAESQKVLGEAFDPAKTLNVVQMIAGADDMYSATVGLVRAVFQAEGVDPQLRQMIILRSAKVLNSPYEWQANVTLSLNNGLTREHIEAAANDGPVEGIAPDFVLACRATDELLGTGTLTDGTLQSLLDRHGNTTTRKIILIIAWFSLLSLFLNGCRVPMETTDKIGGKKTPLG